MTGTGLPAVFPEDFEDSRIEHVGAVADHECVAPGFQDGLNLFFERRGVLDPEAAGLRYAFGGMPIFARSSSSVIRGTPS